MKKQLLVGILCSVMLTGCGASSPAVQPNGSAATGSAEMVSVVNRIDLDDFTFGGCASLALAGNLAAAKAGDTDYETAADETKFTGTSELAWQRLLDGTLDVVLAYEPDEETKEQLEEQGIEWLEAGTDALVFLAGTGTQSEAVFDLTKEDILKAYQNDGSADRVGYAAAPASVERDMFSSIFGVDAAGAVITVGEDTLTAACPHTEGTLCYVTYLSLLENGKPEHTQVVAVNGILPNCSMEAEQAYPLQVPYYIAVRNGLDADDPAMLFTRWLSSETGRKWLEQAAVPSFPEEENGMTEAS